MVLGWYADGQVMMTAITRATRLTTVHSWTRKRPTTRPVRPNRPGTCSGSRAEVRPRVGLLRAGGLLGLLAGLCLDRLGLLRLGVRGVCLRGVCASAGSAGSF